jgi:hypothetical protein
LGALLQRGHLPGDLVGLQVAALLYDKAVSFSGMDATGTQGKEKDR